MTETQELQVSNQNTEIQKIIGGNPDILFTKPELLEPLAKHIEQEIKDFEYDLSTGTSRSAIVKFANKINKTRVGIDKAGKEINRELIRKRDANNEFIDIASERINDLRDKAKKPLTDWEAAEAEKDERRQKVLAEIKILGNSGLDDTSDQIIERSNTLKAMNLDEMDMGDFLEDAKERMENSIGFLKSSYIRVKQAEDDKAELEQLKAKKAEDDRELEELRAEKAKRIAEEEAAQAVDEVKHVGIALEDATEPEQQVEVAVEQVTAAEAPEPEETAPSAPVSAPTTSYDVGDPDEDIEEAQDPRLTKIIAVLCARGELEMFDAIRIAEMLFKGEVPHMELV